MPLPAAYNTTPGGVDLPPAVPPVTANELAYVTSTAEQIKAQKMRNELAATELQSQKEQQNILAKNWAEQGNPLATQGSPTAPAVAEAAGDYAKTPAQVLERYTGEKPAEPDKKYQIQVPGRPTTEWLHEQVKAGAIHPAAAYQLDKETTAMKIKMADGYIEQAKSYAAIIKDDMTGAVESGDHEAVTRILKGAKDMFPDNPIIQRKADDALANIAKGVMPSSGKPKSESIEQLVSESLTEKLGHKPSKSQILEGMRDFSTQKVESGIGMREEATGRKEDKLQEKTAARAEYYSSGAGRELVDAFILNPQNKPNIPARDIAENAAFRQALADRESELGGASRVTQIRTAVASDMSSRKKTQVAADATNNFIETMDLNMNQLDTHITDMAKRLNLDHARLLNMPVREFESKVKGSSDISIYDMLTSSIGKEAGKLMQGGAQSVAPLAEGASKEMKDIYDKNLPVSEMVKLLKATRKEGGNRGTAYETTLAKENDRIASYLKPPGEGEKPPAPVNDKGWKLMVDAKGNKAYVSPDGKDYEEAK